MKKILLIIQHEYLSRVNKRSFLIMTFIIPLITIGAYAGVIYLSINSMDNLHETVYIIDDAGSVSPKLENTDNITFVKSNAQLLTQIESLKSKSDHVNILLIPKDFYKSREVELLSSSKANINIRNTLKKKP